MNALLWRCCKLSVVAAALINSKLCFKQFRMHPFRFRNAFSTETYSESLFSQSPASKLNMSDTHITHILKLAPHLQKLRTLDDVEQVCNTLKKHGCTEVLIAKLTRYLPRLIKIADGELEAKIKLLEDFGFVDQKLDRLLTLNPQMLNDAKNNILHKMEFLKNVFHFEDVLIKALLRAPRLLTRSLEKTLRPSLAFWEGWGFSGEGLLNFLMVQPAIVTCTSLTPAKMDLIHKFGIDKKSKMFKYIVHIVSIGRPKTLEAKIENLKLSGLSAEETWQLLEATALVLHYSKENVSEKMSFITYDMELPTNIVVKHASLLQINLQKTMRPRVLVWQKIKSINDLDLPLLRLLRMSEARFIRKIIKEHPESETLWAVYENAISSNRTKSSAKR